MVQRYASYCGKALTGTGSAAWTDAAAVHDYARPAVQACTAAGILTGFPDQTVRPQGSATRAQMVTFLWKAIGSPEPEGKDNPFKDVSEGAYY